MRKRIAKRIEEGVLKESLNSAIEKADSENVRIIFEEVNSLDVEDEIEIYNIAKIILNRMITSGEGRASGEYCSSESLPKIAAAIIEVEDDMSVYDACCGTGLERISGSFTLHLRAIWEPMRE